MSNVNENFLSFFRVSEGKIVGLIIKILGESYFGFEEVRIDSEWEVIGRNVNIFIREKKIYFIVIVGFVIIYLLYLKISGVLLNFNCM